MITPYITDRQKGVAALIATAILSGSLGIFSHYIKFTIPLFYQQLWRNVFQLVVLVLLLIFLRKRYKKVAKKDVKWFVLRSAAGFIETFCLYIAFTKISIGTTYFLSFAAASICGYIMGKLLFKQSIKRKDLFVLGLSIIGLGLVYSVSFDASTLWYSMAAIVSGIAAPGWSVFSKAISKDYSAIQMNVVDTFIAVVLSAGASLLLQEKWTAVTLSSVWIANFGLAAIFTLVGFLVIWGFRQVDAQTGSLLLLLQIVAGIVLGYAFYRQTISFGGAVGGGIILLAVTLRTLNNSKSDIPLM